MEKLVAPEGYYYSTDGYKCVGSTIYLGKFSKVEDFKLIPISEYDEYLKLEEEKQLLEMEAERNRINE